MFAAVIYYLRMAAWMSITHRGDNSWPIRSSRVDFLDRFTFRRIGWQERCLGFRENISNTERGTVYDQFQTIELQ